MNNAFASIQQMLRENKLTPSEKQALFKQLKRGISSYDTKYLKAVLLPEFSSPCRIPTRFTQSTATFTHRYHTYVDTGTNGAGWVALLPFDTVFHSLFQSTDAYTGNDSGLSQDTRYNSKSDSRFISQNYSQVRLVGASLRIQYMGTQEEESGSLVTASVWESQPPFISDEIVENGYYVQRNRPMTGSRIIYVPRDNSDLEFYGSEMEVIDGNAGVDNILSVEDYIGDSGIVQGQLRLAYIDAEKKAIKEPFEDNDEKVIKNSHRYIGMGPKMGQDEKPFMMVMYWRGVKPAQPGWFRVDVERHFEGVPRSQIRDLVGTARPKANEESLKLLHRISSDHPHFISMSMTDIDKVHGKLESNLANIAQIVGSPQDRVQDMANMMESFKGTPGLVENMNRAYTSKTLDAHGLTDRATY